MTCEWAEPAFNSTGTGETVQFKAPMTEDQRSDKNLGIL